MRSISEGKYPEDICEELLSHCLAPVCQMGGLGGDNMTLIIVCFLHGQPYENLIEKCKKLHSEREKKRNEFLSSVNGEAGKESASNERATLTPLSVESLMNAYFMQSGAPSFQVVGKRASTTAAEPDTTNEIKISPSSSSATSSPTSCTSSTTPENCDSVNNEEKLEKVSEIESVQTETTVEQTSNENQAKSATADQQTTEAGTPQKSVSKQGEPTEEKTPQPNEPTAATKSDEQPAKANEETDSTVEKEKSKEVEPKSLNDDKIVSEK